MAFASQSGAHHVIQANAAHQTLNSDQVAKTLSGFISFLRNEPATESEQRAKIAVTTAGKWTYVGPESLPGSLGVRSIFVYARPNDEGRFGAIKDIRIETWRINLEEVREQSRKLSLTVSNNCVSNASGCNIEIAEFNGTSAANVYAGVVRSVVRIPIGFSGFESRLFGKCDIIRILLDSDCVVHDRESLTPRDGLPSLHRPPSVPSGNQLQLFGDLGVPRRFSQTL